MLYRLLPILFLVSLTSCRETDLSALAPSATPTPCNCATPTPTPTPTVTPSPSPSPSPTVGAVTKILRLRNTYYYIADEADYADEPRTAALYTASGAFIRNVSPRFKRDANIEGTLRFLDGSVWNYAGVIGGTVRWGRTIHAWGRGTANCGLDPFRTIAVDGTVIPYGSLLYVPALIGLPLPDGSIHDGFCRANDAGGAIKRDRMDIFTGTRNLSKELESIGIGHLEALEVRVYGNDPRDPCTKESAK